ncbi:hypothetical protein I0C86_35580 [Plantactinospora sp. S1510]|uniref:Methylamine utilisation protein MauE domain-containing protein n=1 Tax=Plantactinospora alkalitolerans TaxID=2789879 RepID=A0ABS0H7Z8_9ACTN|nr:MauE/DoxX family redox-associated membrane protein [Plantactinospora alkalitolerans]MBF9134217.1 hypothetical protein [Plantactinospora alkalitolerans]
MAYVVVGCEFLVAVVFGWAAASKLRTASSFRDFTDSIARLRIVPFRLSAAVSVGTVGTEAAVPLALGAALFGLTPAVGLGLALLMLLGFIVMIALAMRKGTAVPCPCFGASATPLGWRHIVRNLLLSAIAGAALLGQLLPQTPVDLVLAAIAAVAGSAVALVFVLFDDVVELFTLRPPARRTGAGI